MVNNGTLHYDHDKDGTHTELAGCEAQFRNKDHDMYVAVRYHNYKLTVSPGSTSFSKPTISRPIVDRSPLISRTRTLGRSASASTVSVFRPVTFSVFRPLPVISVVGIDDQSPPFT